MTQAVVPVKWIADHTGRTRRQELNRAKKGVYGEASTATVNGQEAVVVPVSGLPSALREQFYLANPHLLSAARDTALTGAVIQLPAPPPRSMKTARTKAQKQRARARYAAAIAYRAFRASWHGSGLAAAEQQWLEGYCGQHGETFSRSSVRRWLNAVAAAEIGGFDPLDALVDGNDGTSRSGKTTIPAEALSFFRARVLDRDAPPTVRRAIFETRLQAKALGWSLPRSNRPFYDYVATHIPAATKRARRTDVDTLSKVLPYVERGMEVPYRTVQCDHHIADVFVNCEGTVCDRWRQPVECKGHQVVDAFVFCEDANDCRIWWCKSGHRPWLTPIMDTGSRKVVSWRISLEYPSSRTILDATRAAIEREGLFERFYCDNGKDFLKATGWAGLSDGDVSYLGRCFDTLLITRVFAKVRNAQAKSIERWFGTLCEQHWKGTEGYTGKPGRRSERTKFLCKNAERLTTFSVFTSVVESAITIYNNDPHRGTGMRGRTPAEAFEQERIPRRRPDPFAFALVFWRAVERTFWKQNGIVDRNLTYWPASDEVTERYLGARVKLLVNPEDVSRAIICTTDEKYLCDAWVPALAPHSSTDAITESAIERVERRRKAMKREWSAEGQTAGAVMVRRFKQNYPLLLAREAARRREQERELVAAVGAEIAPTVVLPRFSKIARDREVAMLQIAPPVLTRAQLTAAGAAEDHTDEFLGAFDALRDLPSETKSEEDPLRFAVERERIRKIRDGTCEECDQPAVDGQRRCETHLEESWR